MSDKEIRFIPIHQLMETLHTSLQGLSPDEVASRRASYGPNEVVRERKMAVFRQFFRQFKNPLVIILFIASVLSIFLGELVDALIIIVIVVLSVFIDFFQEYRAGRAVDLLKEKISTTATVIREGVLGDVNLSELVPGDIITLSAGDIVPADARVIVAKDFFVDQSALTGESFPVEKTHCPGRVITRMSRWGTVPVHVLAGSSRQCDCSSSKNRDVDRVREDCRTPDRTATGDGI